MARREIQNVFLVMTPLQLLNALEARHRYATTQNALVIIITGHTRRHVDALVDVSAWDEVHHLEILTEDGTVRPRLGRLIRMWRVRRSLDALSRRWAPVERLFVGNFGSAISRHLASVSWYRELILLDDGTDTIKIAEQRLRSRFGAASGWRRCRVTVRDRALGLRARDVERVVFFTSYDVRGRPNDEVIKNDFAVLRKQAVTARIVAEVLFLGQPLVEDGLMHEARYAEYVAAVRQGLGRDAFVYVPHGRESPSRVARLRQLLGLVVRISESPIEVELARSGQLPATLASFYCSALDNCRLMFGGAGMRVVSFAIADHDLLFSQPFVQRVYAYLRQQEGPMFTVEQVKVSPLQRDGESL